MTDTGYYLYQAVLHFEKKDLADVAIALKDIADAFENVSAAIRPCASAYKNDAIILEKELAVFRSPLSLVWDIGRNLIVNNVQIYNETMTAIDDYKTAQWFGFGKNLGLALGNVLGSDEMSHE